MVANNELLIISSPYLSYGHDSPFVTICGLKIPAVVRGMILKLLVSIVLFQF